MSMRQGLIMMQGLPCSGKTYVSKQLLGINGLISLATDKLRVDLDRSNLFNPAHRAATYDALLSKTEDLLESSDLLIDATFSTLSRRNEVYEICRKFRASLVIVSCNAPKEVRRARMDCRLKSETYIPELQVDTLDLVSQEYEPVHIKELLDVEDVALLTLDTDSNFLSELHHKGCPKFYSQIKRILSL